MNESDPAANVSHLLVRLLLERPRYRRSWELRADRAVRPGTISQAGVSKVVLDYLWQEGEATDEKDPRSVRHRIRRALAGERCSPVTLRWIVAAFDMTQEDANVLFQALAGNPYAPSVSFPALPPLQHRTRSLSEFHVIGVDRMPHRHRTVQVIEALTDGLTAYPYRFDTPHAEVIVEEGGSPGPVVPMGAGLWGVWINLSEELTKGQTRSLVYETRYTYDVPPAPEFRRGTRTQVDSVNLRVRFHPAALPSAVYWCTWSNSDGPDAEEIVALNRDHGVERFLSLMVGTLVGFRWEW